MPAAAIQSQDPRFFHALTEADDTIDEHRGHARDVGRLMPKDEPLCFLVLQCARAGCDHFHAGTLADMVKVGAPFAERCGSVDYAEIAKLAEALKPAAGEARFLIVSARHGVTFGGIYVTEGPYEYEHPSRTKTAADPRAN